MSTTEQHQPIDPHTAMYLMCVAMGKSPLESLLLIHEFLVNYQVIIQNEAPPAQAESPYLGREQAE